MSSGIAPSELLKLTYPQLNAILNTISDNNKSSDTDTTSSSIRTYENPSRKRLAKLIKIDKKKQENGSR